MSQADELLKFKELLDAGAITQEEFEDAKGKILGNTNEDTQPQATESSVTVSAPVETEKNNRNRPVIIGLAVLLVILLVAGITSLTKTDKNKSSNETAASVASTTEIAAEVDTTEEEEDAAVVTTEEAADAEASLSEEVDEEDTEAEDQDLTYTDEKYDALDAVTFGISDIEELVGLTEEEVREKYPDVVFLNVETKNASEMPGISTLGTKVNCVDEEGRLYLLMDDGKVRMSAFMADMTNSSNLLIGNTYMKIRNTLNASYAELVNEYTPSYGEIGATQIGVDVMDGKTIAEIWGDDGKSMVAELSVTPAETTELGLMFCALDYFETLVQMTYN